MAKYGIGQAMTRREDLRLLTGAGQFTDDMLLPNQAHVVFVRSPYARACIRSIDSAAARSSPGVIAVYTGADIKADGIGSFPIDGSLKNHLGKPMSGPPLYPLAVDEARFAGQTVAAVIAATRAQAEDAAERVTVDYEELPAVVTIAAATVPNAPQLWADSPGNIAAATEWGKKAECDAAFARAKHVTRVTLTNQRLIPVTMEPRACLAEFDQASGRITVHASCQNPAGLQKTLAEAILKIPMNKVRVKVGDVGGGFGMKTHLFPEDTVCAYAARKLGRPMHWRATRAEDFLAATHGRDQINDAEMAFDADGKILGFRIEIVGNVGAYTSSPGAVIVVAVGPKVITGVYHVPAFHLRAKSVITNTGVVSAYRGAGRPEAIMLVERLMDKAAAEMKMDPSELRRKNLIQPSAMPYTNSMGEKFDSGNFPHVLDRILKESDWSGYAKRKEQSKSRGRLRGRAISTFLEWTGVVHEEKVDFHVQADGRVIVYTAMQAMGQGIETPSASSSPRATAIRRKASVAWGAARSTSVARQC
jgi:aerobic carbon-monoxide dehydrogenase large subunit